MAKSGNEGLVLGLTILITAGLAGGGYWFFSKNNPTGLVGLVTNNPEQPVINNNNPEPAIAKDLVASLPNPAVLTIDGSVTMVALVKRLQLAYAQVNLNVPTTYGVPDGRPNGTNAGIKNLLEGRVLMAASSRPLKAQEIQSGLVGVPIARDALAVVVGVNNPFKGGLTMVQLRGIFQGKITNWSQVGGPDLPIRVINRANDSGTQTFFQDAVLLGDSFGAEGENFVTLERDETTPMLRALGSNGIGYSTVQQVANQRTVRIVAIDGILPTDVAATKSGLYPISRVVILVTKKDVSPAIKEFIELAISPTGQKIVEQVGFIPVQ